MQKKIIALAVAGLVSGAAFAQSNVTIYGIVDAAYVHASGDVAGKGVKFNGVQAGNLSGSRIGFRGTEDLGNGLKAVYVLEYDVTNDTNNGIGNAGAGARQQAVGLSGSFGTATLGRQYAPGFMATAANDPFAGSLLGPHAVLVGGGANTIAPNGNARWNNSVAYASPVFSGLTAKAIYGFGNTNEANTSTTDRDARFGLGANYNAGPVNVDFVYHNTDNNTVQNNKETTEWYLGGSYDLKVVKLMGSYQRKNDKSVTNADNKVWQLGVSAPVTAAGSVIASYGRLNLDNGSNNDSDAWGLGYLHSMSKRTTLYATYTRVDNDRLGAAAGPIASVRAADEKNSTMALGIRHTF